MVIRIKTFDYACANSSWSACGQYVISIAYSYGVYVRESPSPSIVLGDIL